MEGAWPSQTALHAVYPIQRVKTYSRHFLLTIYPIIEAIVQGFAGGLNHGYDHQLDIQIDLGIGYEEHHHDLQRMS